MARRRDFSLVIVRGLPEQSAEFVLGDKTTRSDHHHGVRLFSMTLATRRAMPGKIAESQYLNIINRKADGCRCSPRLQ